MKTLIRTLFLLTIQINSFAAVIVQNGLTQIHDLSKNGQKQGKVLLKNIGEKPESIKIYFNDLSSDCSGKIDYTNPGQNIRSLFPYINVSNTDYTLQPGEEFELVYNIDLSKNTIENGSMWVLMMIEVVNPISVSKQASGLEIGSKIRYAIQLIGNIGEKTAEGISFSNVKLGKDIDQGKVLEVSVNNGGKYLVLPLINLQIYDLNGVKVKDLKVPSKKIYPQNCQFFTLPIGEIPKGKYQAVLIAEYLEENVGVNIDLDL